MEDPKAFAARVSANIDRVLHEAIDPFYSAKEPVEFILASDPTTSYPGRFVRGYGYDTVAVTPAVREEIRAAVERDTDPAFAQAAAQRIADMKVRADGLILLQFVAVTIVGGAPDSKVGRRWRHGVRPQHDRRPAEEQQTRAGAITQVLPTAEVDAYIIANMGYTAETLAALGKATRRDRRREARQRMSAR